MLLNIDQSVINYFSQPINFELFMDGFYLFMVIVVSILLLMYVKADDTNEQGFFNYVIYKITAKLRDFFSPKEKLVEEVNIDSSTQNEKANKKKSTGSEQNDLLDKTVKLMQLISLSTIVVIISFILGIIILGVSDNFMDQSDRFHFGLKKNWVNLDNNEGLSNTDNHIKHTMFYKVFYDSVFNDKVIIDWKFNDSLLTKKYHTCINCASNTRDSIKCLEQYMVYRVPNKNIIKNKRNTIIEQVYYKTKKELLGDEDWVDYLTNTQNLINLNQSFCFSSWILIIVSLVGFSICFLNYLRKKESKVERKKSIVVILILIIFITNIFISTAYCDLSLILTLITALSCLYLIMSKYIMECKMKSLLICFLFSIILYHLTAIAWRASETEFDAKVFGWYRNQHFQEVDDEIKAKILQSMKEKT